MTLYLYKGIDVVASDRAVQLFRHGKLVYAQTFAARLEAVPEAEHDEFLIRQGAVLVDQFLAGDFDDVTLEPWE